MAYKFLKFFAFLFLLFANTLLSQTSLNAGDIAIVGIHADNPKQFSFVALVNITIGTKIYFTDSGVKADGAFRAFEGAVLYTAPTNITAGKIITYTDNTNGFTAISDSSIGTSGFNLSTSGDQIIAFTGTLAAPVFLFAITTYRDVFQTTSNTPNETALPPNLTLGLTAVAVGKANEDYDNATYNLSLTSGTKFQILEAVANKLNWMGNNSPISMPTRDFTITNGNIINPSTLFVSGNGQVIANGDTSPNTIDNTDFGSVNINTNLTKVFTLENNTSNQVTITGINLSGLNATNFSLINAPQFPLNLAAGNKLDFVIQFSGTTINTFNTTVTILNNQENFIFEIKAKTFDTNAPTLIHTIQGSGNTSVLNGNPIIIEGIVTGDFQNNLGTDGNLQGFFVQEEESDKDNDHATSEGIFVYDGLNPSVNVMVGDKVRISGTVNEYYGLTQLHNLTSVNILNSGNVLPLAKTVSFPVANVLTIGEGNFIPDL